MVSGEAVQILHNELSREVRAYFGGEQGKLCRAQLRDGRSADAAATAKSFFFLYLC